MRDFDIAILDVVQDEDAHAVVAEIEAKGCRAFAIAGDIADITRHRAIAEEVWTRLGPACPASVNNAGVSELNRGDLLDVDTGKL
jgi:NAD(P)-dependent dehydrogenase (short-subunit alcohol dehydrogenase family)